MVYDGEIGGNPLSVTVDYYSIELEDLITTLGVNFTLDQCYNEEEEEFCNLG